MELNLAIIGPDIPGLTFRHFRGEADLPGMLHILTFTAYRKAM